MTDPDRQPLASHELLRVMDAARVIHERRTALEEREFDREATIREIQVMYEELGDLVGRRTIGRALDEYLSERHAFAPAGPGLRRTLALAYIRRGWIALRVLLPAAAASLLVWGGAELVEVRQQQRVEREAALLVTLGDEIDRLHASLLANAAEEPVRQRAAELHRRAQPLIASADATELAQVAGTLAELEALVMTAYRIVVTGGIWRYPDDNPDARNDYLIVQAVDAQGRQLQLPIRSEEDRVVRRVLEWGERVSREIYDRVAADKQDNGIIDDDHFAWKRRGFITAERRYPDVGRITDLER